MQQISRTLAQRTLSALVLSSTTSSSLASGIVAVTGINGLQVTVNSIVSLNATITLTGPGIDAAITKLENLSASDKQRVGVASDSNFAPNDQHAAPTSPPNTNNGDSNGGTKMGPIIAGAVGGAILIIAIGYFLYKRKSSATGDENAHSYFDSTYAKFNEVELDDGAEVELGRHRV